MNTPKKAAKPTLKTADIRAAAMPGTDMLPAGFLREVDDAVHEEKLAAFWQTYRAFIVLAVVAMVLVLAASAGWQAWQRHQQRTVAALWYSASAMPVGQGKNQALQHIIGTNSGGYSALAAFELATDTLGREGITPEKAMAADALYAKVYNNRGMPVWLKDVARLNAALALMGHNNTLAKEHVQALAPQAGTKNPSAVGPQALELLAFLALTEKDNAQARAHLQLLLAQPQLPADLKQRASRMLGSLSNVK